MVKVSDPTALAKRMFFLAYDASAVVGMGFLQARPGVTEEQVWKVATTNWDGKPFTNEAHGDYIFGRMMKMSLWIKADLIQWRTSPLDVEYQSWCRSYRSYEALAEAAAKSLGISLATPAAA